MARYDSMIGSGRFANPAPDGYDSSDQAMAFGRVLGNLVSPDAQSEAQTASARKYNAEAALKENELEGRKVLADTISQLAEGIRTNPELASENFKRSAGAMASAAVGYGYDPKDLANLMVTFAGGAQVPNDVMTSLQAGAGRATGVNDAYTQGRQDEIRSGNFAQETSLQGSKNATDLAQTRMQEEGKDRRGEGTDKAPKLGFGDLDKIDGEINARVGQGSLDPELQAKVRDRAALNYRSGIDPANSVGNAMSELVGKQKTGDNDWIPFNEKDVYVDKTATPPAAATPAAPAGKMAVPPAPAARVKGQTYQTPKGPMQWTGTGWVPAAGAAR